MWVDFHSVEHEGTFTLLKQPILLIHFLEELITLAAHQFHCLDPEGKFLGCAEEGLLILSPISPLLVKCSLLCSSLAFTYQRFLLLCSTLPLLLLLSLVVHESWQLIELIKLSRQFDRWVHVKLRMPWYSDWNRGIAKLTSVVFRIEFLLGLH